ncbi:MAG: hypothetical protein K2P94_14000, partial [Rhodospirillaceae bacterium]|nr:hypothetical protein [Rhodospirillaceae bacterium]
NNLNLIAPHDVIEKLRAYSDEISIKNTNKNRDKHDKLLSELFLSIRRDLDISPPDDREAFSVKLWASGVKTDR